MHFTPVEFDATTYFGKAYTVQATMRFVRSEQHSCMGLNVVEQYSSNLGSVQAVICTDRQWKISFFDANGTEAKVLRTGLLKQAASRYVMRVRVQGTKLALQLNGAQLASQVDVGYTSTNSVSLVVTVINGNPMFFTQVLFSDFSVQPATTPTH